MAQWLIMKIKLNKIIKFNFQKILFFFNIEGQKNRKLLEILELTSKKKRKKGNLNEIIKLIIKI